MKTASGMNVRFDMDELQEVRAAITSRRDDLDKIRVKMGALGLATYTVDNAIEVVDRCKVAIGDEPEDMFSGLDKSTGEIKD